MADKTMPERIYAWGTGAHAGWEDASVADRGGDTEYVRADLAAGDPNEPLAEGQYRWACRKDCGWEVGWVDDADGFCLVIDGMNYYEDELSAIGPVIRPPTDTAN